MKVSDLASLLLAASPEELRRAAQDLRFAADFLDGAAQGKAEGALAGLAARRPDDVPSVSERGTLSSRLHFALKRAGLCQAELERKAGLTAGFLSRPLSGKAGTIRTQEKVRAIARVCGVNWLWLMHGEGEPLPSAEGAALDVEAEGQVNRG